MTKTFGVEVLIKVLRFASFFSIMENILRLYNQKNAAGKNAKMPPEQRASPALWTFSGNLFFYFPMYTCFDFSEKHIFIAMGYIRHFFSLFRIGHFWFVKPSPKFL